MWDRLPGGPYPGRCRRYGKRMGGYLKILGKQKQLIFNIILKMTPQSPDTIMFKKLLLLTAQENK